MCVKIAFLVFIALVGCASAGKQIVGGQQLNIQYFPWQIAIQSTSGRRMYCGGSIINDTWILTAKHCLNPDGHTQYSIRAGATFAFSGGQLIPVAKSIPHPTYDVGLLKLSKSLTFNNNVKPIKLAESNTVVPTGTKCWVSGWGDTQDPNIESFDLRGVEILVLDYNKCKASYDKIPKEVVEERVGPVHICAGYDDGKKDSCQGDSGGPLATWFGNPSNQPTLVGVVSWGYGCALANYPGVYVKVSTIRGWIRTETGV